MPYVAIMFLLCCGAVIAYCSVGFSIKVVLACSILPTAVLCLVGVLFHLPWGAFEAAVIGTVSILASMCMQRDSLEYGLILVAAALSVEIFLALHQFFLLCIRVDPVFAVVFEAAVVAAGLYMALAGQFRLIDPGKWLDLIRFTSPKGLWKKQFSIYLALLAQISILSGLSFLTEGVVRELVIICGALLFLRMTAAEINTALLQIEVSTLQDIQVSSQRFFHAIRAQRHDFMIHVHTIHGLLSNHQIDSCREYVEKLVSESQEVNDIIPVENPAVGALLNDYLVTAQQHGIRLVYTIKYDLGDIICSEFELNRILGNMLQNAIDEVSGYQEGDRWIKLLILKRMGRSVIKVTNCFRRDPAELSHAMDMNKTTKSNHEGIGLKNIERIVKKYGGVFFIELETEEINVIAQIPNRTSSMEVAHADHGN